MLLRKRILITLTFLALAFAIIVPNTVAKGNEYDAVCNHLKTKYKAKKVKIPFMWLARFAVGIVRPAGVKSFKVTMFRDLQITPETLNEEMKLTMQDSFSEDWSPILRIRNRDGNQIYMNMRESGDNIKILVVSIDKNDAVVVRAKFNPEKLAEFVNNPQIFGISIDGNEKNDDQQISDSDKDVVVETKQEDEIQN